MVSGRRMLEVRTGWFFSIFFYFIFFIQMTQVLRSSKHCSSLAHDVVALLFTEACSNLWVVTGEWQETFNLELFIEKMKINFYIIRWYEDLVKLLKIENLIILPKLPLNQKKLKKKFYTGQPHCHPLGAARGHPFKKKKFIYLVFLLKVI